MAQYPYQSSTYTYQPGRRKLKKNNFKKIIYILIAGFFIFVITSYINHSADSKKVVASDKNKNDLKSGNNTGSNWGFNFGNNPEPTVLPSAPPIKQNQQLLSLIKAQIPDDNGKYGVFVKGVETGEEDQAGLNEREVFPAASLYKLFLMATALEKIEQGQLSLDTHISAQIDHLEQVYGSADFGYEGMSGETITYTVEEILDRIARVSNNYASIMLAEKIGWDDVRLEAQKLGAYNTSIKDPISTTPADIAHFFELLYQRKVVSPQSSDKLIELLASSQLNDRIPDGLPTSLKIAHKTGELNRVRNDAGIVFVEKTVNSKGPYIIVLMSKDLVGEDSGVDTLSDISKVVYEYFNMK